MGKIAYLDEFWRDVPPPPKKLAGPMMCPEAAEFHAWCQALLAEVGTRPTPPTLVRAKLALQDKLWDL